MSALEVHQDVGLNNDIRIIVLIILSPLYIDEFPAFVGIHPTIVRENSPHIVGKLPCGRVELFFLTLASDKQPLKTCDKFWKNDLQDRIV